MPTPQLPAHHPVHPRPIITTQPVLARRIPSPSRGEVATLLLALVGTLASATPVRADPQPRRETVSTLPRGGATLGKALSSAAPTRSGPSITTEQVGKYTKLLGLDDAQAAAVGVLHTELTGADARAKRELNEKLKQAEEDAQDGLAKDGDDGAAAVLKAHARDARARTDAFFADLRSLLREDQAQKWPALERLRRRELWLPRGSMSGSTLDLSAVIAALKLTPDAHQTLRGSLDEYESELDRPLKEREDYLDRDQQGGVVQVFTPETFRADTLKRAEIDAKVREVNQRWARRLTDLLPTEHRAEFERRTHEATFRQVYREPSAVKRANAARALNSASAQQRAAIQKALEAYRRDAAAANERWADAIARAENAGRATSAGPLGSGRGDPDVLAARQARQALDRALRESVEQTLTPEQRAELPNTRGGRVMTVTAASDGNSAPVGFVTEEELDADDIDAISEGGGAAVIIEHRVEHRPSNPDGQPAPTPPPAQPPAHP